MIYSKLKSLWSDYNDEAVDHTNVGWILLISLGINITEVFIPMYVYIVFQNIIPKESQESLLSSTVIVIAVIICGSILKKNREEIISRNRVRNQYLTTNKIYKYIIESHEPRKNDISVSEFNRINRSIADLSEKSIAESFSNLIDTFFGFIFLSLILLICGVFFTTFVIIFLILFTLIANKDFRAISSLNDGNKISKERLEDMRNDFIEDIETNLMRIRLDNLDSKFVNEYENIERDRVKSIEIARDSDIRFVNKLTVLSKLFSILIISTGAVLVITGSLQSGLIIVGLLLSSRTLRPWRNYLISKNRDSIQNNILHKYNNYTKENLKSEPEYKINKNKH